MSAVKGGFGRPPRTMYYHSAWEVTPKWHWRSWIGHCMRQYHDEYVRIGGGGYWRYRTFKQHAHQVLRENYDDVSIRSADASSNYIAGGKKARI